MAQAVFYLVLFAPIISLLAYYQWQIGILNRLEKRGVSTNGVLTMKIMRENFIIASGGRFGGMGNIYTPPERKLDVNFKYTDAAGKSHIVRVKKAGIEDAYSLREGQEFEILYLPENPGISYPVILFSMRRKQLLRFLLIWAAVYFFLMWRFY